LEASLEVGSWKLKLLRNSVVFGGGDALRGNPAAKMEKRDAGSRTGDSGSIGLEDKRVP
jgi:hypothetical protein